MTPRPGAETRPTMIMLLSLHDVCPTTWATYKPFLDELDQYLPHLRYTLLVVPDFHREGRIDRYPGFCSAMDQRLARGDELALHGYSHRDERPVPWYPRDLIMRRVLTHEGEFHGLSLAATRRKMAAGLEIFRTLGWPVNGFIAPGWLLGSNARQALEEFHLTYTADRRRAWHVPDWRDRSLPTLVWSARSCWRRTLWWGWTRLQRTRLREAPVLRLAIHPVDVQHGISRRFWIETILQLAPRRRALTKGRWIEEAF